MQINPYLHFNGQCETAFRFYEQCLGAKILAMFPYEGTPMEQQVPPDWRKKIIHGTLKVGDDLVMGSDVSPDRYQEAKGFSMSISVNEPAEAERLFNALAKNANVQMPLQKTFWAARFGMLVDQFGVPWMVNCEQAAANA